jgi:hypothetical protein
MCTKGHAHRAHDTTPQAKSKGITEPSPHPDSFRKHARTLRSKNRKRKPKGTAWPRLHRPPMSPKSNTSRGRTKVPHQARSRIQAGQHLQLVTPKEARSSHHQATALLDRRKPPPWLPLQNHGACQPDGAASTTADNRTWGPSTTTASPRVGSEPRSKAANCEPRSVRLSRTRCRRPIEMRGQGTPSKPLQRDKHQPPRARPPQAEPPMPSTTLATEGLARSSPPAPRWPHAPGQGAEIRRQSPPDLAQREAASSPPCHAQELTKDQPGWAEREAGSAAATEQRDGRQQGRRG